MNRQVPFDSFSHHINGFLSARLLPLGRRARQRPGVGARDVPPGPSDQPVDEGQDPRRHIVRFPSLSRQATVTGTRSPGRRREPVPCLVADGFSCLWLADLAALAAAACSPPSGTRRRRGRKSRAPAPYSRAMLRPRGLSPWQSAKTTMRERERCETGEQPIPLPSISRHHIGALQHLKIDSQIDAHYLSNLEGVVFIYLKANSVTFKMYNHEEPLLYARPDVICLIFNKMIRGIPTRLAELIRNRHVIQAATHLNAILNDMNAHECSQQYLSYSQRGPGG